MLAVDLYCGLGGWAEGLLDVGYRVVGFDVERHRYGEHSYPGQLVLQDVRTLHGSQLRDATLIVASPPCQEFSWMAMPWRRGKQVARALRGEDEFPENWRGSRTVAQLTELFDACFRIRREAEEAGGRRIPLVVENVCGAQKWVGRARWHYGSYYLWGDVPALMPITARRPSFKGGDRNMARAEGGHSWNGSWSKVIYGTKVGGLDWSAHGEPDYRSSGKGACFRDAPFKNGGRDFPNEVADRTTKVGGDWFSDPAAPSRTSGSRSHKRKAASARIAKIPYRLAWWIGYVYAREERTA